MKVFISWSGARSKVLAESLRGWVTGVINAVEPWISSNDINPGARWGIELTNELEKTRYGILCVTEDNLKSPWLMYEAGALSKQVIKTKVVPLLLDNKPSDIEGPLAQFQSIQATEEGIKKLIIGINGTVIEEKERGIDEHTLSQSFNLWWPRLNELIKNIPSTAVTNNKKEERSERDIIEETLNLVRDIKRGIAPGETLSKATPTSNTDDSSIFFKGAFTGALRDLVSGEQINILEALKTFEELAGVLTLEQKSLALDLVQRDLAHNKDKKLEVWYQRAITQLQSA